MKKVELSSSILNIKLLTAEKTTAKTDRELILSKHVTHFKSKRKTNF